MESAFRINITDNAAVGEVVGICSVRSPLLIRNAGAPRCFLVALIVSPTITVIGIVEDSHGVLFLSGRVALDWSLGFGTGVSGILANAILRPPAIVYVLPSAPFVAIL